MKALTLASSAACAATVATEPKAPPKWIEMPGPHKVLQNEYGDHISEPKMCPLLATKEGKGAVSGKNYEHSTLARMRAHGPFLLFEDDKPPTDRACLPFLQSILDPHQSKNTLLIKKIVRPRPSTTSSRSTTVDAPRQIA